MAIWFLFIDGKREGPWSFDDLKKDKRITPDTLVWREGFDHWEKIRDVPELQVLFDETVEGAVEEESESAEKERAESALVLNMGQEPPFFLGILIALLVILYMIFLLYKF